ncbi:unnamed protein product [Boreogadus saida]
MQPHLARIRLIGSREPVVHWASIQDELAITTHSRRALTLALGTHVKQCKLHSLQVEIAGVLMNDGLIMLSHWKPFG